MKITVLLLFYPFIRLAYFLGGLVPRRTNLWVFGSYANAFNDNSKYLFTHVVENHPDIDAVWITNSPAVQAQVRKGGGVCHLRWSFAGLWSALRGRYWFVSAYVSDINYYASRGAHLINLWHGTPLKNIEFDIRHGVLFEKYHRAGLLDRTLFASAQFRKPDELLSASPFVTKSSLASAFRLAESQCLALGYPRNDVFSWPLEKVTAWVQRWCTEEFKATLERVRQFKQVYVYMPTWRDAAPDFLLTCGVDWQALNGELHAKNAVLVLKLHVATPAEQVRSLAGLSNVLVFAARDDIYPLLPLSRCLITDYSSIYLDYLLLDRPICFFVFDLDKYRAESRGFYYPFAEYAPGEKVLEGSALLHFIRTDGADDFAAARSRLLEQFAAHRDGEAAARLVRHVRLKSDPITEAI